MTPQDRTTHQDVEELLSLYAMDAASPDEAQQVERHVARCSACHAELQSLLATSEALSWAPQQTAMPDRVRGNIMAAIDAIEEPAPTTAPTRAARLRGWRRPQFAFGAMAACLVLAVGALGVQTLRLQDDSPGAAPSIEATMTGSSNVTRISTQGELAGVHAEYADVHGVGMIVTKGLPKPPSGYTYRVWGVTPAHDMHAMGELAPRAGRDAMGLQAIDAPEPGEVDAIEITLEPVGVAPVEPVGDVVGRARF